MATFTWTGAAGDGNFQNPANWSPQQVPGSGATVTIAPAAAVSISVSDTIANLTDAADVTLTVADYRTLQIGSGGTLATFSNGGQLLLDNAYGAGLLLDARSTSLTGSGTVVLNGSVLEASAAGQTLSNLNNTIEGYGYLGNGTLALTNAASGVIDANVSGAMLGVNTGTATLTNAGLLEATGGGNLQIDSSVSNTGTGSIAANGGTITFTSGTISGGTLAASNGGAFMDDGTVTLSGRTSELYLNANLAVADYSELGLLGTIGNAGTLSETYVHGSGILIGLTTGGTVTLTGGGTVSLQSGLQAAGSGDLLNNLNNTIEGSGALGGGTNLAIINAAAGLIAASGGNLALDTGTATLTNHGLVEATASGTLSVSSAISNGITGQVTAAGGYVYLEDGSSVLGGTLSASAGGLFVVSSAITASVLNGVTNTGTIDIADNAAAILVGTFTNTGGVTEAGADGAGLLVGARSGAAGTVTLTGGGTLTLASGLQASQSGDTLDNVNNLIAGSGLLGDATNLAIINAAAGVIDVTGALTLDTGTATTMNAGLIEATGAIIIESTVNNGASGQISAAGGTITLDGGDIQGGTLTGSAGAYIVAETSNGTLAVLDGTAHAIVLDTNIEVPDGGGLMLEGTIVNNGAITPYYVNGPGIVVAAGTVFTNNGTLAAGDGGLNFGTGTVLTNDHGAAGIGTLTGGTYEALGNTLGFASAAVGTLGAGTVLDVSNGAIDFAGADILTSLTAILAGGAVSIGNQSDAGSQTLTNAGTLTLGAATYGLAAFVNAGGGTLTGNGDLAAALQNSGTINATGGELDLTGKTNSVGGTVTGGAGDFVGFGGAATLLASAVVTASDLAVLDRASLQLGAKLTFSGTFDIRGNATLSGAALFSSGLLEQVGTGIGTIAAPVTSTGTITTGQGGTLAFANLVNSGLILDNGRLTDSNALKAGALTVGASGFASIGSKAGATNSVLSTLTVQGGLLTTNGTTLTVTGDYDNTAAGSGNSYTPFAGVTGTIDGNGTRLTVAGVSGTTITSVGGTDTITLAAGKTAYFEIKNTGAATAALLRGALETSVTGTALSGSGVTASNFGPLAGGAASGVYAISYDGSSALSGESIHIASDFANVAGITIDIVSSSGTAMAAAYAAPEMRVDGGLQILLLHHG